MNKCKYCGGTEFLEGPSGGLSTNVLCANTKCRHWFNHTPFDFDDLNRVEPTAEECDEINQSARNEIDSKQQAFYSKMYVEGKVLYTEGKPAYNCTLEIIAYEEEWYGCVTSEQGVSCRLAGWIDAFVEGTK